MNGDRIPPTQNDWTKHTPYVPSPFFTPLLEKTSHALPYHILKICISYMHAANATRHTDAATPLPLAAGGSQLSGLVASLKTARPRIVLVL